MAKKKSNGTQSVKVDNSIRIRNLLFAAAALTALSFVFIVSEQTGVIGKFFRGIYFTIFGIGAFVAPLYLLAIIAMVLLKRFTGRIRSHTFWIGGLLLLILALIAINSPGSTEFGTAIENARSLGKYKMGVGVLGASIGWVIWRLLGKVGGMILVILYVVVMLLVFLRLSVKDVLVVCSQAVLAAFYWVKNKIETRPKKEKKTPEIRKEPEQDDDAHSLSEIAIVDYSDHEPVHAYSDEAVDNDEAEDPKQMEMKDLGVEHREISTYTLPSIDLLESHSTSSAASEKKSIQLKAEKIVKTLSDFGISAKVTHVSRGPTVTCFEMEPAPGVKVSRIVNLADDLALSLAATDIRIVAPLPGKAAVGLEVPNETKDTVSLKEILDSQEFRTTSSKLPFALGKTISGKPIVSAIEKMPHLLIAGATGSGKSVCINTMIMSILYSARPDEVKLVLIDPKVVELSVYNGIPHLIVPVVTQPKKASAAMFWAVEEMERRYQLFSTHRVRDITSYKAKAQVDTDMENLPYIVIIIDELADLMMVAAGEVENYIARLAQMARACGIHLIVATQRPSVDVITGTIKANIPSRISFQVSSQVDSRTILDMAGAEKLLGKGDMLFYPSGFSKPLRIQGAFVTEGEVERVVSSLKATEHPRYDAEVIETIEEHTMPENSEIENQDPLLTEAIDLVIQEEQAAVSLLQRKLRIGYSRAGRLIDDMENMGIIGKHEGSRSRKVLISFNPLKEQNNEFGQ